MKKYIMNGKQTQKYDLKIKRLYAFIEQFFVTHKAVQFLLPLCV